MPVEIIFADDLRGDLLDNWLTVDLEAVSPELIEGFFWAHLCESLIIVCDPHEHVYLKGAFLKTLQESLLVCVIEAVQELTVRFSQFVSLIKIL